MEFLEYFITKNNLYPHLGSSGNFLLDKIIPLESLHNLPLVGSSIDCDWEREDQPFGDSIRPVRWDGHRDPFAGLSTQVPITHVVTGSLGRRHGRRELSLLDDCGTALLDDLNKISLDNGTRSYAYEFSLQVGVVVDGRVGIDFFAI